MREKDTTVPVVDKAMKNKRNDNINVREKDKEGKGRPWRANDGIDHLVVDLVDHLHPCLWLNAFVFAKRRSLGRYITQRKSKQEMANEVSSLGAAGPSVLCRHVQLH